MEVHTNNFSQQFFEVSKYYIILFYINFPTDFVFFSPPDVDNRTYDLFTLPAKKWHWRARTSAIYFAQTIPQGHDYQVLFSTSVLNLSELIGMRPDLANCTKIVYFHENQLIYPVREIKERDCQYGLNEIMTRCEHLHKLICNNKKKANFVPFDILQFVCRSPFVQFEI